MAARTHVWLLEQGSPPSPEAVQPWLMRRLVDPAGLALPWAWLRGLVAWVLVRLRAEGHRRAVAALPGPAPEVADVTALAAGLERQLGRRYRCAAVLRHGRPDAAAAAAEVKRGAHVVLLPLGLVADATQRALLADARAALASRRARLAEVTDLGADDSVLAALVRGARRAILEVRDAGDYRVLVCAFAEGEEAAPRVEALHDRLVALLRLAHPAPLVRLRPFGLGADPLAGAAPVLDLLADQPAVVVVPLGPLTDHADGAVALGALTAALQERGVGRVARAAPASACPGLAHALYARVKAAERAMEWPVPEDAVQADVRAELERQGAVWLPRRARP